MKKYKNYLIPLGYTFISILLLTLIFSIFNYFNVISNTSFTIIKLFIPIISILIGGILVGKNTLQKGYINGIKFGAIIIVLLFLIALLGFKYFKWGMLIYYFILVLTSMLGSMIGINFNKNKKE